MIATLNRERRPDCTMGALAFDGFECLTLELPWIDNRRQISCIPDGTYQCSLRPSAKFGRWTGGMVYQVQPVTGRTDMLIRAGNTVRDTLGCILVGDSFADGMPTFIRNSRATLVATHLFLAGRPFTLTVNST